MIALSETQKVRLSALADAILPASPTMPSAGRLMNGDGAIDCVMRARPDLFVPLAALLDTNTDRTVPEFLETLATQEPESFSVLMQVVAGAYYLDDGVRKTIGYNGQRAIPLSDIALASPAFEGHTTRKHQRFRSI